MYSKRDIPSLSEQSRAFSFSNDKYNTGGLAMVLVNSSFSVFLLKPGLAETKLFHCRHICFNHGFLDTLRQTYFSLFPTVLEILPLVLGYSIEQHLTLLVFHWVEIRVLLFITGYTSYLLSVSGFSVYYQFAEME